jgi:hypothetical protein
MLNGICARFRGKAKIQNKTTRTAPDTVRAKKKMPLEIADSP